MKVLFITRGYPSKANPMDGNYEAVQAKAIKAKGHEVINISIKWKSVFYLFKWNRFKYKNDEGIQVYEYVGILPTIPFVFNNDRLSLWMKKRILCKVYSKIFKKQEKPNVVHSHSLFISEFAIALKKKYSLPIVFTEHWSKLNTENIDVNLYRKGQVYHEANNVIAVSNALSEKMLKHFGVKSQVIYNMVDNSFFDEVSIDDVSHSKFTFVSVGNLLVGKGFDTLVKAFFESKFPSNVVLNIIGEGGEREKLEELIRALHLTDRVKLLGVKSPVEVSSILAHADIFVLASRKETFGIVYVEAMAKGLPVIATKCGGPEEFVNKQNGILVPVDNVEELSKAMLLMYKEGQHYCKHAIRKYSYENFSQDVVADKILKVYRDIL